MIKTQLHVQELMKDYRGFNLRQQMAVLQNQWWLNGRRNARDIFAQDLCSVPQPNACTYDLRVVIPGSAEKQGK